MFSHCPLIKVHNVYSILLLNQTLLGIRHHINYDFVGKLIEFKSSCEIIEIEIVLVRDDLKLPDDGRGIPKSQGRGLGGSNPGCEISSLLDGKTCQVVNCLLCFGAGLSAFCLKKKKKKRKQLLFIRVTQA